MKFKDKFYTYWFRAISLFVTILAFMGGIDYVITSGNKSIFFLVCGLIYTVVYLLFTDNKTKHDYEEITPESIDLLLTEDKKLMGIKVHYSNGQVSSTYKVGMEEEHTND